jgi:hypothetical protein
MVVVAAAATASCSDDAEQPESDAGFVYLDANEEGAVAAEDGPAAPPASCAPIMTLLSPSAGCRADWDCGARGLYTFVCGVPDGGASTCYCIAGDERQASGAIDGCGGGEAGVRAAAVTLCGWTFAAATAADGGAQ